MLGVRRLLSGHILSKLPIFLAFPLIVSCAALHIQHRSVEVRPNLDLAVSAQRNPMNPDSYQLALRLTNVSAETVTGCLGPTSAVEAVRHPEEGLEVISSHQSRDFELNPGDSVSWLDGLDKRHFVAARIIRVRYDVYRSGCRRRPVFSVYSGPVTLPEL